MQMHPITFPPDRRNDPKRRAEARVFDEINASRLPGFAHYEWQRDHKSPQLDLPCGSSTWAASAWISRAASIS